MQRLEELKISFGIVQGQAEELGFEVVLRKRGSGEDEPRPVKRRRRKKKSGKRGRPPADCTGSY